MATCVPMTVFLGPLAGAGAFAVGLFQLAAGLFDAGTGRSAASMRLALVTALREHRLNPFGARWTASLEDAAGVGVTVAVPESLCDVVQPGAIGAADLHAGWIRAIDVLDAAPRSRSLGSRKWRRVADGMPTLRAGVGIPLAAGAAPVDVPPPVPCVGAR
jgi:hypothetical protein